LPNQLTQEHYARRLATLASLPLPDDLVKDAIVKFVEANGLSQSKNGHEADSGGSARRGAAVLTGIKEAVLKVISMLDGEFTYREVQRGFGPVGYQPDTKNLASSIGRVLRNLAKEGTLVPIRKGVGGDPSVFKRVSAR
jgi:hypothetical protein